MFVCACLGERWVFSNPNSKNSWGRRWFHRGCGSVSQGQFDQPVALTPLKQAVTANPLPSPSNPRQSWANPKLIQGHSQLGVSHRAMPGHHGHGAAWSSLKDAQFSVSCGGMAWELKYVLVQACTRLDGDGLEWYDRWMIQPVWDGELAWHVEEPSEAESGHPLRTHTAKMKGCLVLKQQHQTTAS